MRRVIDQMIHHRHLRFLKRSGVPLLCLFLMGLTLLLTHQTFAQGHSRQADSPASTPINILKLAPHPARNQTSLSSRRLHNSGTPNASSASEPNNPRPNKNSKDLYGVVLSVKEVGAVPESRLFKPGQQQEHLQQEHLQKVEVKLDLASRIDGLKSPIVVVDNSLGDNPAYNIPLKPGTRVLLTMEQNPNSGQNSFYLANRNRTPALMILGTLMVLAVLLIGGPEVAKHGLLAVIMLMGIYKALFPAIMAGSHGMDWLMLMCFMFTILGSFIYQAPGTQSFSREQSVVILSTLGGLLILSLILWLMRELTPLNGYSSEGLADLWYLSTHTDYWTLYLSSVLIGFQGFLFYLCWMLAQQRHETEFISFSARFRIVMIRGRRLLGPLISSLSLLFFGLLLPILLQLDGTPTAQFINQESTASILTFAFAGGLTLILTVPLTALIAAWRLSEAAPQQSSSL